MSASRKAAHSSPDDPADAYVVIDTKDMELPGPRISPKDRSHMPLSAAAHWIASQGGKISITADERWWQPAFEKLIAMIVSGKLATSGRRSGLPEAIPGDAFVGIPVAYPCSDSLHLWTGDGPYLECLLFIDDADWQRTGGDKLLRSGRDARGMDTPPGAGVGRCAAVANQR
jgi:hypothetical protein